MWNLELLDCTTGKGESHKNVEMMALKTTGL